jgi:uncharacterized membrane protein
MHLLLSQTDEVAHAAPMVVHPLGVLAVLLVILAGLFRFGEHAVGRRLFGIVPRLVFCYFIPTLLTTLGVIPQESPLYDWIRAYLLPASLLLLILALDVPGILRLGPKAVIMLLAGTFGVVIGGPLALFAGLQVQGLFNAEWIPADTWQGMSALCGSWIGGGANMVALGDIAGVTGAMFGMMVIVDVFVANIWMGVLLYLSGMQDAIDRHTGANTAAI